ncbi:type II secretion system F family protein [soil metagenome]
MSATITFDYKALNRAGAKVRGRASATSEAEAFRRLAAEGLTPLALKACRASRRRGRIAARDVAAFTGQLAVLLNARLSVGDALLSIGEQESNPALRTLILDVAARIEAGEPIAAAMQHHCEALGDVYIQTVRAAEVSGTLGRVLEHLAEMLERSDETRRQLKSALMYPMIVIVVLAIAVTFLLGFVVPKFARMFKARGVALPELTQVLMFIGESMQSYWFLYLGVIAGTYFGIRKMRRTVGGAALIDRLLHRVPVIKGIMQAGAMSRFAHVLGLCMSAGIGLIESVEMAGRAAARPGLTVDVELLAGALRTGARMGESLRSCQYITTFAKRMLTSGEISGEIQQMCKVIARHYDRDAAHVSKQIATLVEPVLVVAIAGVVLIVALGIFLPMWNMVNLVG